MVKKSEIRKVYLFGRGSARDETGNPYYAYRAVICLKRGKNRIELQCPMDWGSSDKSDVFNAFREQCQKVLGLRFDWKDIESGLVEEHYYSVSPCNADKAMEYPHLWRITF